MMQFVMPVHAMGIVTIKSLQYFHNFNVHARMTHWCMCAIWHMCMPTLCISSVPIVGIAYQACFPALIMLETMGPIWLKLSIGACWKIGATQPISHPNLYMVAERTVF